MEIIFLENAIKDIEFWKKTGNQKILNKISSLLKDISANPYYGIGKPEPLRYELSGKWSRRINSEHRIIYSIDEETQTIHIYSLRYHYKT